ncbi:peptide chain release factor N(5)-glutamine methyltransferase [Photobacterium sp. 2_MG-2023]|uniref:peptide chain release factor N(5)-glutamine methyltransferase n=1 Tax=Photobacterium sp. 2_MG-2023 TaxID=3062663 RepID=UPI0026E2735F|nr:peptide chain release factor N(5)-glutamine methyltransferase [Photobacterium sp. 2_MG-2023]MDO6583775.1 peptide chain release factor N(5)-glutamine methyltransferase [Photobacterium sp. 2_MG-2023]
MNPAIDVALKQAVTQLMNAGSDSPQLDAAVLLCHVLDKPRSYLLTWPEKVLTDEQSAAFSALLARRESGEPVAYITGEREFWSLPLKVAPHTLIPRPDTERLVEAALEKMPAAASVLDLGTGTGAIALSLASERPDCQFTGIDLRPEAVALAEENRRALQLQNVRILCGSWFNPLPENARFDVIVGNPPYIDANDPHLASGDVRFEPRTALVAEDAGLADIRHICSQSRTFLTPGGWLLLEHGYQQGEAVRGIFSNLGYQQVITVQDYAGQDRVSLGCWSV